MTANHEFAFAGGAKLRGQLSQLSDLLEELRADIEPLHLARKRRFDTLRNLIQGFESTTEKLQFCQARETSRLEGSGAKSPAVSSNKSPTRPKVKRQGSIQYGGGARRERTQGPPPSCRASKSSKMEQIRKVFDSIVEGSMRPSTIELQIYICDFLGFGVSEGLALCQRVSVAGTDALPGRSSGKTSCWAPSSDEVSFERFQLEYHLQHTENIFRDHRQRT